MRRILTTFALLFSVWLIPLVAAVTVAQTPVTFSANDPVVAFGSTPTDGNAIVIVSNVNSDSATLQIDGAPSSVTTLAGPIHRSGQTSVNFYAFCFVAASSDNAFTVTTTASSAARGYAVELAGTDGCTLDGTLRSTETSGTSHALSTDVTTSIDGSILLALVGASSADFSCDGSFTCIPSDGTDIGSQALGQYLVASTAGTFDTPFTSVDSESALVMGFAIAASGGAVAPKQLLMMGVGRPRP